MKKNTLSYVIRLLYNLLTGYIVNVNKILVLSKLVETNEKT